MPDQQAQPPTEDLNGMTADEHAAALGYITTLSEQMMPQEMPEEGEAAPEEEVAPTEEQPEESKDEVTPRLEALEGEIKGLKDEVGAQIKDSMKQMKELIQDALKDDEQED